MIKKDLSIKLIKKNSPSLEYNYKELIKQSFKPSMISKEKN